MDKATEFKIELKELLKKYNAEIYVDMDGDTHGVSAKVVIDIDNKPVLTSGSDICISHHDIK